MALGLINKNTSSGSTAEYTLSEIGPSNEVSLLKDGRPVATINLTQYLDDTNVAQLISGELNPTTGILTVVRDDESAFEIDLSGLIDVQPTKTSQLTNDGDGSSPFVKETDLSSYTLSEISPSNEVSLLRDGTPVATINLTQYLDDTNLARLVSGELNPTTGILTVVRDDASTFQIDLSSLIDVQPTKTSQLTNDGDGNSNRYLRDDETTELYAFRDAQASAMTKSELNTAYKQAQRGFIVVVKQRGVIYLKVDDTSNDWLEFQGTIIV